MTDTNQPPDGGQAAGRDAAGRFAAGNRYGRGRKDLQHLAELQAAVRECVEPRDVERVLATMHKLAIAGDTMAAKVWLDRVLGKPDSPPQELHHVGLGAAIDDTIGPPVPTTPDLLAGIEKLGALARELLGSPAGEGAT